MLQYTIDCEADSKLKAKCDEIICAKTKDVLKSDEFPKISSKCLAFLLDQNSLNASEAELFISVCLLHLLGKEQINIIHCLVCYLTFFENIKEHRKKSVLQLQLLQLATNSLMALIYFVIKLSNHYLIFIYVPIIE